MRGLENRLPADAVFSVIPIPRVDGIISTPSVIRRSLHYVLDIPLPLRMR